MKKVLIITYQHGSKSRRMPGLIKYLPQYGFEPIVVTRISSDTSWLQTETKVIKTGYVDVVSVIKDKLSFRKNRPSSRTSTSFNEKNGLFKSLKSTIRYFIAFPDDKIGWIPSSLIAIKNLLRDEKVDVILSSSLPNTAHLIARHIKRNYGVPWIADYRDLWTQYYNYPTSYPLCNFRHYLDEKLELWALKRADALVTVSKPLVEKLNTLHKREDVYCILNGYDQEDFRSDNYASIDSKQKFVLTYAGALYEGKRDPRIFLNCVSEIIDCGDVDPTKIEIHFYGDGQDFLKREVKKNCLQGIVHVHGFRPRVEVLHQQLQSDLLLWFDWNDEKEEGIISGKIFEYFGAKRTILAICPFTKGIKELLECTNSGVCVSTPIEIKAALQRLYKEKLINGKVLYSGKMDEIKKYSHREMAKNFADLFSSVVAK